MLPKPTCTGTVKDRRRALVLYPDGKSDQQRMFGLQGAKAGYALAPPSVRHTEVAGWQINDPVFRKCIQASTQ